MSIGLDSGDYCLVVAGEYLLEGGGGQVDVPQEPPELHGWGVALGQAGEVVVGAGQELPQLVGDGDGERGHWKYESSVLDWPVSQ